MSILDVQTEVLAAKKARWRRDISELDYRRAMLRLNQKGETQVAIAKLLEVSQPTVQNVLRTASRSPQVPEGFSGAHPFEICERYAADLLSREQLVDELTRWSYTPRGVTTGPLDDLLFDEPGSTDDLARAHRRGLIDDDLFDEVVERLE